MPLPRGFTLDTPQAQPQAPALPPGFTIDGPEASYAPAPDNTESVYQMKGPKGQIVPVKYSKVREAEDNHFQLIPEDLKRYNSDTPGALTRLAQWGAEKFPYISVEDEERAAQQAGGTMFGKAVDRNMENSVSALARGFTAAPAAFVGAVKDLGHLDTWTPVGHLKEQQHKIDVARQNGTLQVIDADHPVPEPTSADLNDWLAEQEAKAAGTYLAGKAGSAVLRARPAVTEFVAGSGKAGGVATPSLANRLRLGAPPSSLTPAEQSAVAITKAVNPSQPAWNNYLDAAHAQTGNVLEFAQRNGMPISDARDFAKVAKAAHDETIAHFHGNFLNPSADVTMPVEGTGYQGKFTGRGRATLADINARIDEINRELNANTRKPTTGQAAAAGASDAELESERRQLTPILHRALADAAGVAPSDIAALRVRGGQLKTLGSESQGAANSVAGGSAKVSSGAPSLPTSQMGVIKEGLTFMRGGPERISAGKLRDALNNSTIPASPLVVPKIFPAAPTITTPDAAHAEFLRNLELEQASQDAARGRSQSVATYKGEQAAGNRALAEQEAARQAQLTQASQDAAQGRRAAVQTFRGERAAELRAASQQEFLRRQQLTLASQDAAAGRSKAVQTYRDEQASGNRGVAQQEFLQQHRTEQAAQAASTQRASQAKLTRFENDGQSKLTAHIKQFPASGLSPDDLAQLKSTAMGRGYLSKASSLAPGSPMMKRLVEQIAKTLGK